MLETTAERVPYKQLFRRVVAIWRAVGFPETVAEIATTNLLLADMRGINSHGVARLPGYIRLVKQGRINTEARPFIEHETLSTARLNGDGGLGLWVGHLAQEIARKKARAAGSGWVAVNNSSHFGIAAAHTLPAAAEDMIGMSMTNASPLVAPAGAARPYWGTNPICVAMPCARHPHFVLDMATSAAANGKLEIAQRQGASIPHGWALDAGGLPTQDANALKAGGTLLPLGSSSHLGVHKGSGLGAWVDIMSGVLSGANYGQWVPPFVAFMQPMADLPGKGLGHFIGAWQIEAFLPAAEFKERMSHWIEGLKSLDRAPDCGEILIPGEPEHKAMMANTPVGPQIEKSLIEQLDNLSRELGVDI